MMYKYKWHVWLRLTPIAGTIQEGTGATRVKAPENKFFATSQTQTYATEKIWFLFYKHTLYYDIAMIFYCFRS